MDIKTETKDRHYDLSLEAFMVKNVLIEGRHMNNSTQILIPEQIFHSNQAINVQDKQPIS